MLKLIRALTAKKGLPPGTPVYVGERKTEAVKITVIDYDEDELEADFEDLKMARASC